MPSNTPYTPEITPVMIEEASIRCSIDRFRSLLPPKIKTRPTYPPRFARISTRALPCAAKKSCIPWIASCDEEGLGEPLTLTDELLRFAEFVSVSTASITMYNIIYICSMTTNLPIYDVIM